MIKEDYVSFEIAKLLKEKGFDSESVGDHGGFYSERCYEPGQGVKTQSGQEVGIVYDDLTNSDLDYDEYLRPTTQMAMKWLREVHNIFIQIELYSKLDDYCFEVFQNTHRLIVEKDDVYNSYEAACEAAIKYCLKLI